MKALLTAEIVLQARRRYAAKEAGIQALAREVGVTNGAMYCALTGRSWAHVPEALGWGFGGRKTAKRGGRVTF